MTIGTKSILFGVHQFAIHPFFVAAAWWRIYGFPCDLRLWAAFFLHDLGYWGKPNMDGYEGETHPEFAARIMAFLFGQQWGDFALLHSRFYAKKLNRHFSMLCVADKLAIALTPPWLYLAQARASGELAEYMQGHGARTPDCGRSPRKWLADVQRYCRAWAYEHCDGRTDTWTGTKRDMAMPNDLIQCGTDKRNFSLKA
jgi:hypothetical protein